MRYGLLSAEGISEVASIGGFVREYQVDVNPEALHGYGFTLAQVCAAIANSNLDVGARVTEISRVEYLLRGVGFIERVADLEEAVVTVRDGFVPVRVRDVARVALGPLEAINNIKARIDELGPGLPARALEDWERVGTAELREFAAAQGFEAFAAGGGRGWTTQPGRDGCAATRARHGRTGSISASWRSCPSTIAPA